MQFIFDIPQKSNSKTREMKKMLFCYVKQIQKFDEQSKIIFYIFTIETIKKTIKEREP